MRKVLGENGFRFFMELVSRMKYIPRKDWKKTVGIYSGATFLSVAILTWVMQLWRADLAILFDYVGDALFYSIQVKGVIDHGWYLHNSSMGVPLGLNLYDFPLADNFHLLLIKVLSLWTRDFALLVNLFFLLTFPLTALTSVFVFRRFALPDSLAIVGGVLFAFLPYHFLRGEAHLFYATYYQVPLMVMVILWVCQREPLFQNDQYLKSIAAVAICILVASGGIYYAFFGAFFLLIAGAFAFFRHNSLRSLVASVILLTVIFLGLVVNLSPNLTYIYRHGGNFDVIRRSPAQAEIYGLKMAQLLLPINDHRIPRLARLKEEYNRQAPLVNENSFASLGIMGSLGFLILIGWLVCGNLRIRNADLLNSLGILNVSAVLLATTGGFSSLFALLIYSQIRGYNRMSIYIAFFSLFAVLLFLEELAQKMVRSKTSWWFFYGSLGLILLVGLLDQTTPSFVPPYKQLKAEYTNDADFIALIETSVPENAMIFQLPFVSFPDNPVVHRIIDYDHFRGYLHSKSLRWSYAAMKGRDDDSWQQHAIAKPLSEFIETLAFAGFSGIYLDRYGYIDSGAELEANLSKLLGTKPIVSANQRLLFFNLSPLTGKLHERYTAEEWQLKEDAALHPILLQWKPGFSVLEGTPENNWRWCSSRGELNIENSSQRQREISLQMFVATGYDEPSSLRIESPWFAEEIVVNSTGQSWTKMISVPPGKYEIRFASTAKKVDAPADPRILVFRVVNFRFEEQG